MLLLNTILFVAVLSVMNAAIIVNIYDGDGKDDTAIKEVYQEVQGCDNQYCDWVCRLQNFPGGICSNGRCKCNYMKQTDELILNNVKELGSCNWRACDQLCRRLGFPDGVCVGDKCKCNFRLNNKLDLDNVKEPGSCNLRACDQLCRRLGFPGGVCVGDKCKCDNFKLNNKEDLLNVNDLSANENENAKECNNVECENFCQKLGLVSGYCYQDRCICCKKEENKDDNTFQGCNVVGCNEMCHRMNYIGGGCRNGSCYCY